VKAKTAQMDADLATQQAGLEAQEQAAEIAREKVETMDGRITTLSEWERRRWRWFVGCRLRLARCLRLEE
jgi:hypothetical protein